jgi:hypothetical protein
MQIALERERERGREKRENRSGESFERRAG